MSRLFENSITIYNKYTKVPDNWRGGLPSVFGECDKEISTLYTITDLQKEYKSTKIKVVSDSTDQNILPKWDIEGV
jgi:hypothetical protein